ncbi:TPA: hypothetical protein N0F65_009740 [Lagenidium giganteum]|uniref:NADH:ubiquinone oxidoreductase intermediate-associated protein 30 domain-containing protein n=1 Tax=Lagenidium giganteum TaxID=4803 RepID=A0AAV2YP11_9STRA|nr:TPA: hypothetical protein N0F65_009740 [Lagenidium giganteum]
MSFLRKTIVSVESAILSSRQSLGLLKVEAEKDIFTFNARDATREWIASSDRSIGGGSKCQWGFYHGNTREQDGDATVSSEEGMITTVNKDDNVPSAVFSGNLSLACQPTEAGIIRSGYCAVRGALPAGLHFHGYKGIGMRIMTDGREYRMNLQTESWNPLNLYMGFLRTPANEWVDVELPFDDFMLTAKGYYKFNDPTKLDPSKLKSIGFAIADQKEGDFELRIQWIKALHELDQPSKSSEDDDEDDDNDNFESR